MKKSILLFSLALPLAAGAQVITEDPLVLAQQIIELARQGDPAAIQRLAGLPQLMGSLGTTGVGRPLADLQKAASGFGAFTDTGNGLYQAIQGALLTPDGKTLVRVEDEYRKYDAITQTAENYKAVHDDTESRRTELRQQIKETTAKIQSALTTAEVDKLKAVVVAQGAEVNAIDHERDAAATRVQVQDVQNRNDAERQQQARNEDHATAMQEASDHLGGFLKPDTAPLQLPAPRH